jgi:hypothetical protein
MRDDSRIREARGKSILKIAEDLGVTWLRRVHRTEFVGPCPVCGGHEKPGSDRFGLNDARGVMNCRKCGLRGGVIDLVMAMRQISLPQALDWMLGPGVVKTAADIARDARLAEEREARKRQTETRMREDAVRAARAVWDRSVAAEDTAVRLYLERRGVSRDLMPVMPACLRFDAAARYMVAVPERSGEYQMAFAGPAMVAEVQGIDGRFSAVHRTWLDLDQPKGKAVRPDPFHPGRMLDAKKGLGSKKGGAIRLLTPKDADTLVIGEGIETTLSALVAGVFSGAAYWAAVDLGNIAGRRAGRTRAASAVPDMSDSEAFVPPEWVRRLILIMDGDSNPETTRSQLYAGARRAMALRPGLRAQIVVCPPGTDLNDILMGVEA